MMPTEGSMQADIALWNQRRSTEDERPRVKPTSESSRLRSLVANNIVLAIYPHLTNPDAASICCGNPSRRRFIPYVSIHRRKPWLDEGELFNMYREVPSITKGAWALKHYPHLDDPGLQDRTPEADQAFLRDSSPFTASSKAMWFYTGFAPNLSLGRRTKMSAFRAYQ